jgi:hypothetical protein
MANIRKSFNFRSGLQVDSSNFTVNPNGLVGIGTSIPTEALDLIGNAKISGLTTTTTFAVGSGATFYGVVDVGDISLNSSNGIVSATSFRGDGSLLDGVVAIATEGFIVNLLGLHTFKSVGIGTSNQSYYLQIEGDPTTTTGVGITNGIVRASDGFIGDLTGTATTANNLSDAANITTGTISLDRLPTISFATTATNLADAANITTGTISLDRLPTISFATTATNLADAANITTGTISSDRLSGSYAIDITGTATTATNLADAANITTGTISSDRLSGSYAIDITGTATTATNLTDGANITTGTISSDRLSGSYAIDITGTATMATNLTDGANITTGTISDDRLPDTITSNINILSGTSYFNQIGVNTTTPQSDIHVRKDFQAEIQVTSNSSASLIGIGRSNNITGYNGVLRYGNTDGAFAYSDAYSLDIMNYGTGNINYYLNPSEIAGTTGGFFWHKETQRFMALTSAGNLGIGVTNPTRKLEVFGTSYVSGDVEFGNNLNVNNNVILGINGRIGINSSSPTEKLDIVGNIAATGTIVAGDVTGTSFTKVGGSSTEFLKADGSVDNTTYLTSSTLGVVDDTTPQLGGNLDLNGNNINGTGDLNVIGIITATGGFTSGIGVTNPVSIRVSGNTLTFNVVGVGSTSLTLF